MKRPPKIPVKWDKEWVNKNTTFCQLRQVFDIGLVTIRLIRGNVDCYGRLIIWMPEKYLSYEQLDRQNVILEGYCQKVANWFMKTYVCQLGLPEVYQKPHFGFPEDPDFVHIAKKMNVSTMHSWFDDSDGHAESETDDIRLAKVKLELPERVLRLEYKVDCIASSLDSLIKIFDVPSVPDSFRDVV